MLRFMLSDRANPLRRAAFNRVLNSAAVLINRNKNFQKNSRGLDSLLAIQLPGAVPLFVRIKDETIGFPERSSREPDMTLRLTDEGLRDIINGASLKKLFFEKKVLIEGNIPLFRLHTDLLSSV
ncbi:MAG: SCP2 sterol-binding domain-containing protein [bacterium]